MPDISTFTGAAVGATDLGVFTGATISNGRNIKQALQELESAVEGVSSPSGDAVQDADGNTTVEVERTPNDDTIRHRANGTDVLTQSDTDTVIATSGGVFTIQNSTTDFGGFTQPGAGVVGEAGGIRAVNGMVDFGGGAIASANFIVVPATGEQYGFLTNSAAGAVFYNQDNLGAQTRWNIPSTGHRILAFVNNLPVMSFNDGTGDERTISIQNASSAAGETTELQFNELSSNGTHSVGLKAPDSVPISYSLTLPDSNGDAGDVLTTDGAGNTSFQSSGLTPGAEQNADFTASKNRLELVDVSGGPVTVTPPASPNAGDRFGVSDSRANASVSNIAVSFTGAGDNFHGGANDHTIDTDAGAVEFIYTGATVGWIIHP